MNSTFVCNWPRATRRQRSQRQTRELEVGRSADLFTYGRLRRSCDFFLKMSKILSVTDVTNACIGYTRPIREGEQVLNAIFVISVGLKSKEGSILHIQALVLRTSGITTQHPYSVELWVDLEKEYGSRVIQDKSVECECKAGESEKCKHIIAVMLHLSRLVVHISELIYSNYPFVTTTQ